MKSNDFLRNLCIGLVDGLTIPLALAAGLSGLVISSSPVIVACLAVACAGAVTMSIGGYLEGKKYGAGKNSVWPALSIGLGYLSGGVITTVPFLISEIPLEALPYSVVLTLLFLFFAGYQEGRLNHVNGLVNAIRVTITGAIAAGAAYLVAKLFT